MYVCIAAQDDACRWDESREEGEGGKRKRANGEELYIFVIKYDGTE